MYSWIRIAIASLFSFMLQLPLTEASQGQLFWIDTDRQRIMTAALDGTGVEQVAAFDANAQLSGLAVDAANSQLYWYENQSGQVRRSNLDGTGAVDLFQPEGQRVDDIALDLENGHLYWVASLNEGIIGRANLDGSDAQVLLSDAALTDGVLDVALDVQAGKLYWTALGAVRRANLDGSSAELVTEVPLNGQPTGIALDLEAGYVYFAEDGIWRAPVEGGEPVEIAAAESPSDLVVAPAMGKVFWAEDFWASLGSGNVGVFRADLDGNNVERLVDEVMPEALVLIPGEVGTAVERPVARGFEMTPAYPNPFYEQARLTLTPSRSGHVTVVVYDMLGRTVTTLFDGPMNAGNVVPLTLEAGDLANGVYSIRASGAFGTAARSVVVLK